MAFFLSQLLSDIQREIAQFGRAPSLELGGHRFESCFPIAQLTRSHDL